MVVTYETRFIFTDSENMFCQMTVFLIVHRKIDLSFH